MKVKFVLIIVATLIIGFIAGFVTSGQITKSKIQNFVRSGTHEGFKGRYYHIIRPDEQQKEVIDPILDKYGFIIHENVTAMQQRMKGIHHEMLQEIEPYLTGEQKERLKESVNRFERRERMRQHKHSDHDKREKGHKSDERKRGRNKSPIQNP
jgi:hypothetical protein